MDDILQQVHGVLKDKVQAAFTLWVEIQVEEVPSDRVFNKCADRLALAKRARLQRCRLMQATA